MIPKGCCTGFEWASVSVYSGDIGNTSFRDMGNSFEPKGSPIGSSLQVSSSG